MVSTSGVDGESTEESLLAIDGESEVSGSDKDALAGQAAVDADDEVAPTDVASFVDRVDAGRWCAPTSTRYRVSNRLNARVCD